MSQATEIILPPNVSGFVNIDEAPLIELSANDLQNYCEVACQSKGYDFLRFIDLSGTKDRSYHLAEIAKENQHYLIFLNKYHKVVAFAKLQETLPTTYDGTTEMPRNAYADLEDLASAFQPNYMVLPTSILIMPIDADIPASAAVVQRLKDIEFGEFSYWVPQNIGQVVFNGWQKNK